jgi:flagellar basal-body rod protein FlgC
MRAMEIGMTALDVEWRRLEVIAENLANANTAGAPGKVGYRELQLVSGPRSDFSAYLDKNGTGGIDVNTLQGVAVREIVASSAAPHLAHEPGNPAADSRGFVAYPAIDHAQQMTQMVQTARNYEANIAAMNIAREMYSRAVQLGRNNP